MVAAYYTQYPKIYTNDSAKLVPRDILDCITWLLHPRALLQTGIILSYTEIQYAAISLYRQMVRGTVLQNSPRPLQGC